MQPVPAAWQPRLEQWCNGLSPYRILARALRLRAREAHLSVRGFSAPSETKRRRLEAAGEAFIFGYNIGLIEFDSRTIRERLATITDDDRGFAFEGAAMGVAVGDALPFSPAGRLAAFLADLADDYFYLGHVGVGWAMARPPWRSHVLLATLDPL